MTAKSNQAALERFKKGIREAGEAFIEHHKKYPSPELDYDRNPLEQLNELAQMGDKGAQRDLRIMLARRENYEVRTDLQSGQVIPHPKFRKTSSKKPTT